MNINRNNYEEFFILYGDNELSATERLEVESFVQENADLQAEFSALNMARFSPDEKISFPHMETLLQDDEVAGSLSESMLLYLDNEMSGSERNDFEQSLSASPEMQAELASFRMASFDPNERISFPYKQSLYRREEKGRLIPLAWRRIAAAAAILLAVSVTTFVVLNRKEGAGQDLAGAVVNPAPLSPENTIKPGTSQQDVANNPPNGIAGTDSAVMQTPVSPLQREMLASNDKPLNAEARVTPVKQDQVKPEGTVVNANNLPKPLFNPNVNDPEPRNAQLATNNAPKKDVSAMPQQINSPVAVTPKADDPLQLAVNRTAEPGDDDLQEQPSRKNKFRGFLRKVTRTFEKTTNIKATDEDDRLLVGALAIRL